VPYNATAHRWWRVIDSSGTFRVQTSPEAAQWTDLGTAATPAFFSALGVRVRLRALANGDVGGPVVFDNANGGGVVSPCQ